jgi:hypothetical protein
LKGREHAEADERDGGGRAREQASAAALLALSDGGEEGVDVTGGARPLEGSVFPAAGF